jgi:hypothetical protein
MRSGNCCKVPVNSRLGHNSVVPRFIILSEEMSATSLNLGASLVGLAMAAAIVSPRRLRRPEVVLAILLLTVAVASAMITLQPATCRIPRSTSTNA